MTRKFIRLNYNSTATILRAALLIFCFIVYLVWSWNLPLSMAPDEHMRMMVPTYIVQYGELPRGDEPQIINSIWGSSYGFSTYGSSLFAIPFMVFAKLFFGDSAIVLLLSARFSNVVLSMICLVLCCKICDKTKVRKTVSIVLVCLVGLLPQYVFLSSYFNSDIIQIMSTGLVMYAAIAGYQTRWKTINCIGLGFSLGILALSNYYAYGSIVASIIFYYGSAIHFRSHSDTSSSRLTEYLVKPLIIFISAFVVAGWFFVRNFFLYNGDIFGLSTSAATAERFAQPDFRPSLHVTPKSMGMSPLEMLHSNFAGIDWVETSIKSFIGYLGTLSVQIGDNTYTVYKIILVAGFVVGAIGLLFRLKGEARTSIALSSIVVLITPILLSIYYSWASDYQAQGRYFICGLILFMYVVASGYWYLTLLISRISNHIPFCTKIKVSQKKCLLDSKDGSGQIKCVESISSSAKSEDVLLLMLSLILLFLFLRVLVNVIVPNCFGDVLAETFTGFLNSVNP